MSDEDELPDQVKTRARILKENYPDATIEIEQRWVVRAAVPIHTSNIGHTRTVALYNLKGKSKVWK